MNVYDFDKTIYRNDCTLDFWKHCIRKYPKALCALPTAAASGVMFKLGLCERERFKEKFYTFLQYVPDSVQEARLFWNDHMDGIKEFYYRQRRPDDLVISASPEFLIREVCTRLGIAYIASRVNPATGKLEGPNCRGQEKVRRFREIYPSEQVGAFYSDSRSDIFMARESQTAYLVRGKAVVAWE